MYVGFDYGTAQCAVSVCRGDTPEPVVLHDQSPYFLSCLYASDRSLICDYVAQLLPASAAADFRMRRQGRLRQAQAAKLRAGVSSAEDALWFGPAAWEQYVNDPAEGFFIKSPKSFLGASGLPLEAVEFFEDVVTAMMHHVKQLAQRQLGVAIDRVVIGRPVNFQGINAQQSNQQALGILSRAAEAAGFSEWEFLYEPIAAGLAFEQQLTTNKTLLVVDIGGGTTDCSLLKMGPDYRHLKQRQTAVLATTGERIGGNDVDNRLALEALMPAFGAKDRLKSQLPMPIMPFFQACAINHVAAQAEFYGNKTSQLLQQLQRDAERPELLQRFIRLRENKQNFALVKAAEIGKHQLSAQAVTQVDLHPLGVPQAMLITQNDLVQASGLLIQKMLERVHEAVQLGQCLPDLIYLTGGGARLPGVREALTAAFDPPVPVLEGDHFGSVAAGLALWAKRLWGDTVAH
jgi:hypothetical chaperone protein